MESTHQSHTFALNDRASNYGDGVFTTMSVANGRIGLFERHIQRLIQDAGALGLEFPLAALKSAARQQAQAMGQGVLKLLLSAGNGGRGYTRDTHSQAQIYLSTHTHPAHYSQWRSQGIQVNISPIQLASQPALGGIKHLNRLEQVLIKNALQKSGAQDALVCDQLGRVVEASAANVFWYRGGCWFTPEIRDCGVAGVMRGFLLDWLQQHAQPVEIGQYAVSQIAQAESVLLCNALMPIVPVSSLVCADGTRQFSHQPALQLAEEVVPDYEDEYDPLD